MTFGSIVLVAVVGSVTAVLATILFLRPQATIPRQRSVLIVVLGDIGRSPRMQYHALSIAKYGGHATLVGYLESEPLQALTDHDSVDIVALSAPSQLLQTSNKAGFLFTAPLKVLWQVWNLWSILAYHTVASEWMLVQNPPSIPTLLVAILVCWLKSTKLVIDWHNFGYSILALKLGNGHLLVRLSKLYERYLAGYAFAHFAVTNAMVDVLKAEFRLNSPVISLHDRPAPLFAPFASSEREAFLEKHELTHRDADRIINKQVRLVVSSTSWTPDEDFSVLLDALRIYSASAITDSPHLPELLVIITGKGPLKPRYMKRIQDLEANQELEMVKVRTSWLSFEDYASLLAAADLGVSLHTSSSGVDLPMKVVDMFGAGLPVLGYSNFKAWPELVQEHLNGRGFTDAQSMAEIMKSVFDTTSTELEILKKGAIHESKRRWDGEWLPSAGRLFHLPAPWIK